MAKEKMSLEKKGKLLYSGELILIGIVFIVLAILRFVNTIGYNETKRQIFNWVTIFGSSFLVLEFIWTLFSKKKQAKACWIDKILNVIAAVYVVSFDIYCFIQGANLDQEIYKYGICILFTYIAVNNMFQGVYHYFKPTKALLAAIEEDTKRMEEEQLQVEQEANKNEQDRENTKE